MNTMEILTLLLVIVAFLDYRVVKTQRGYLAKGILLY